MFRTHECYCHCATRLTRRASVLAWSVICSANRAADISRTIWAGIRTCCALCVLIGEHPCNSTVVVLTRGAIYPRIGDRETWDRLTGVVSPGRSTCACHVYLGIGSVIARYVNILSSGHIQRYLGEVCAIGGGELTHERVEAVGAARAGIWRLEKGNAHPTQNVLTGSGSNLHTCSFPHVEKSLNRSARA